MRLKDMKIREIITIMADTPVDEIAILLTEHHSGGLPAVDDKNQVIGDVLARGRA
jgi:CBS domain-containing protein